MFFKDLQKYPTIMYYVLLIFFVVVKTPQVSLIDAFKRLPDSSIILQQIN